jgi:hypothetical protein
LRFAFRFRTASAFDFVLRLPIAMIAYRIHIHTVRPSLPGIWYNLVSVPPPPAPPFLLLAPAPAARRAGGLRGPWVMEACGMWVIDHGSMRHVGHRSWKHAACGSSIMAGTSCQLPVLCLSLLASTTLSSFVARYSR